MAARARDRTRRLRDSSDEEEFCLSCHKKARLVGHKRKPLSVRRSSPESKSPEPHSPKQTLSPDRRAILMKWVHSHWDAPYPTFVQKQTLAAEVGLRLEQLQSWFINFRTRYWVTRCVALHAFFSLISFDVLS